MNVELIILGLLIILELFLLLNGWPLDGLSKTILVDIRLPRVILAILAGVILAGGGLVFQSLFNNPLADSFSLGIASGASFGSAVAVILGLHFMMIPVVSMSFSLLTLVVVMILAHVMFRRQQKLGLILFGMFVNFFFASALYGLSVLAPEKSRAVMNYLFGSIGGAEWKDIVVLLPFAVVGMAVILMFSRNISILSLGEELSSGLGLESTKWMNIILMIVSVMTASLISITGIIGFVGLIVPQLCINKSWSFHWKLIHTSLMGAILVIACDLIGSRLIDPIQIPVSVVLSIVGLPILVALSMRANREKVL